MSEVLEVYECFSRLLGYPRPGSLDVAARCHAALVEIDESAAGFLASFVDAMKDERYESMEELYTQTFDMGPARALEIGWHLYGENYDRGTFLVWMRQQLREASLAESHELPDHISHVLLILGRMDLVEAAGFSCICVLPAMNKVRAALKGDDNPYGDVVRALCAFLEARHGPAEEGEEGVSLPVLQEHEQLLAKEEI